MYVIHLVGHFDVFWGRGGWGDLNSAQVYTYENACSFIENSGALSKSEVAVYQLVPSSHPAKRYLSEC